MTIANRPPLTWGMAARTPGDSLYPSLWYGYVGGAVPAVVGRTDHQDQSQLPLMPTVAFPYTFQWVDSPIGPAWNSSTGPANGAYLAWPGTTGGGNKFKIDPPCSFLCYFRTDLTGFQDNIGHLFQTDADNIPFGPTANYNRGITFAIDYTGDVFAVVSDFTSSGYGSGSSIVQAGTALLTANTWYSMVWVLRANDSAGETIRANNSGLWLNGADIANTLGLIDNTGTATASHANTAQTLVNAKRSNTSLATGLDFGMVCLWNRPLDNQEAALLSVDPVAMWRRNDLLRQPTPMLHGLKRRIRWLAREPLSTEPPLAATAELSALKDAYIRADTPTTNYGTVAILYGGRSGAVNRWRSVLHFDLSNVSGRVETAILRLMTAGTDNTEGADALVCRLTETAWVEDEVTWERASTATDWTDGGSFTSDGQVAFNWPGAADTQFTIDIATLVQDALDNRSSQLHILIKSLDDTVPGAGDDVIYYSREATPDTRRPLLTIN